MPDLPDESVLMEKMARAMQNAVIRDDEGEFPCLFDLLGFSGENKSVTVTRGLAQAALSVLRPYLKCQCGTDGCLMGAQAYQVIGYLDEHMEGGAPKPSGAEMLRAMDYFSGAEKDEEFLPWPAPTQDTKGE